MSIWRKGLTSQIKDGTPDLSEFKAFPDNNLNLSDRIENIVGKGENTGYLHFLLFSKCFQI